MFQFVEKSGSKEFVSMQKIITNSCPTPDFLFFEGQHEWVKKMMLILFK